MVGSINRLCRIPHQKALASATYEVGESEMQSGQLSVKNMVTGEQGAMTVDELLSKLS